MKDIFLADAHLRDPADANYRRMLRFLDEQRGQIRTLYLLGDIFDFWVGYRHVVFSACVPLLDCLRRLRASGAELVYVEGNHDFNLGPYFGDVLGCRILPDGGAVDLDGKKVFIAHGDLANPDDAGYRLLRRFLRSAPTKGLIKLLPPDWTWAIGRWSSNRSSHGHNADQQRWIPEALLLAHARERFAEGFAAVVTGHYHFPLQCTTEQGTMVALGDWIEQYSYATWEEGNFTLHTYEAE
ncbi:MAG: UDP-2,3-diacylglucosamine diphosphatase [Desulfuromonadales bacterium]